MYIQLISIHGLVRGDQIEMGRNSDTGGQVRYVVDLARTLAKFENVTQVDLFTRQIRDKRLSPDYAEPIEELAPNCRIVRLPCGGGRYYRKERLWPYLDDYADAMIAFTRREGRVPAFVHGHYADAGYVGMEVASAFAVPFVFTGHSLGRDKKAYLVEQGWTAEGMEKEYAIEHRIAVEERCLACADLVVTSTRHERETQYARYDNGSLPRFEIIPPGTSLERFFPYYDYELGSDRIDPHFKQARMRMQAELDRFHLSSDKPLILALCRPDKRKNIGAIVQAYGEDRELQHIANLAIFAGIRKTITDMPDSERSVLTDILLMMDQYDLYGRMAVPKRLDSELEVPELYRLAASRRGVFVNTAFVEPFGLTYIESSAVGLPFVGTENGGPQDIVANCDSGILVDVNDIQQIAAAMKKILTDRDTWEKFSNNGINRVREHYTWEQHCETYLDATDSVVKAAPKSVFTLQDKADAPGRRLADVGAILITDIDNTLLGDEEALGRLLEFMRSHRSEIAFGVASGRYLDKVVEVMNDHHVGPLDVVISSVGTEIYYGPDLAFDKGWASHLRSKWKRDKVAEALDDLEFITLQKDDETQQEFKISYDLDDTLMPHDEAMPIIYDRLSKTGVPHTLIFSHDVYIDILPQRASKGKAVRYLSGKWNVPIERIVTAGDSGNDIDMLKGKTAGIVVSNYSSELEPLKSSPSSRIYFAKEACAAGILDGLRHYGFAPSQQEQPA
ncbi:MAG: HAD-IIB family hydrolase [Candidatus Hydrogenedens sp.]|nr:HAD-IIB family hydrolase [Candidatus Hydrogenedens sp.]